MLPPDWLMLVTVTVAVKLPVADPELDALAMGTRRIRGSSNGKKCFRVFLVAVLWPCSLLFIPSSMLGSDLVVR